MRDLRYRRGCRHRQRAGRRARRRAGRLLGRAECAIDMHQPDPNHAEHDSEQIWRAVCAAVRGAMRSGRRARRAGRRHQLRRHLLAGRPRPGRRAAQRLAIRRGALGHHRLARPPRARRGGGMHGERPPRAGLCRRRDVAGDGDSQADVAEPPSAGGLGARRHVLRPRRFPDLERERVARPLAMHAHLQMDLSRPRATRLAGATSSPPSGMPDMVERGGLPRDAPARSAPISAR